MVNQDLIDSLRARLEGLRRGRPTGAPEVERWSGEALEALRLALDRLDADPASAAGARLELEAVLRHLPIGVILAESPTGRVLTYNRAVEEIFRGPPPLPGSVAEYSAAYEGYRVDGRRYGPDEWPMARALTRGEVVVDEEIVFVRRDGERILCLAGAAPVRSPAGELIAGVITLVDVTRKRLEEERQALLGRVGEVLTETLEPEVTVQRLAALCAEALGAFCLVHVEEGGRVRGPGLAGPAGDDVGSLRRLLRHFPLDSEDHPVRQVLREGEPALLREIPDALVERVAPLAEQREIVRGLALSSALVAPMKLGGRVLGTLSLARAGAARPLSTDELELAEQIAARAAHAVDNARLFREAKSSAQARDEILSLVSHDLRNSLNAALMNADLLLEIAPVFEAGTREHRQMDAIRRSLDHMHRLVQDLLEVDRIERGRLSVHPAPLHPAVLRDDVPESFGQLAHSAGVELAVEIAADTPMVLADQARLMQVLSNLIGNAVRFTPREGRVTLSAEATGPLVRFRVADTGPGIGPDELPRVFDRFYQGGDRGGDRKGSGLGLTIARGIVEAHGGRMGVESTPGAGSVFWFTLPTAARPSGAGQA